MPDGNINRCRIFIHNGQRLFCSLADVILVEPPLRELSRRHSFGCVKLVSLQEMSINIRLPDLATKGKNKLMRKDSCQIGQWSERIERLFQSLLVITPGAWYIRTFGAQLRVL